MLGTTHALPSSLSPSPAQAGRFSGTEQLGEKDFRRWGQPRFQGEAFEANKARYLLGLVVWA